MRNRTTPFTFAVVGAALTAAMLLSGSVNRPDQTSAIVVLCAFALVGDLLLVLLPQGAYGSFAFIPNLCAILVAPSWQLVAAMAIEKAIAESARRA